MPGSARVPLLNRAGRSQLLVWLLFVALLGTARPTRTGTAWAQFRGPDGLGVADDESLPLEFGPTTNLVWKTALPTGNSSACVWGDRLFVTGYTAPQLETLCLEVRTGTVLWKQGVPAEQVERGSSLGNPASPTPVTDGRRVYAYFGPFGVVCYDLDGHELWRRPLPLPVTQHGVGTSPVLADDRLILLRDQDLGSHLLALDPADGRTVWDTPRPEARRGFSTPLLWSGAAGRLLIVPGTLRVTAYRVRGGAAAWSVDGLPNEVCASPVSGNGLLFAGGWTPGSGVPRMPDFDALLAQGDQDHDGRLSRAETPEGPARHHFNYIDADKDGFLTRSEYESLADIFHRAQNAVLALRSDAAGATNPPSVVWKQTRGLPYVASPLWYRDRIYLVKNGGLVSCLNATNGTALYLEERVGALGDYYASPVAAQGRIYLVSQPGTVVILAAEDSLTVLARHALGDPVVATPAIAGRRLYVRSRGFLWAFGEPTTPATSSP